MADGEQCAVSKAQKERTMKKRMAAAMIAVPTLLGGVAISVTGGSLAHAYTPITVCKREVLSPEGWRCVEWVKCEYDNEGNWACADGFIGGPPAPRPPAPVRE